MPTDLPPPGPPANPPGPQGPQGPQGPYGPYLPSPGPGAASPYGPRRSKSTVIVLITLAAIVAVALVSTAILLRPGKHAGVGQPAGQLRIQQVIALAGGGCPGRPGDTDSADVPAQDGRTCYEVAPGLTIAKFAKVDVVAAEGGGWAIRIGLRPADGVAFEHLTTDVYRQPPPRNQLALVINGKVISAPVVQEPIRGGQVQIDGGFTRDAAERIADQLND